MTVRRTLLPVLVCVLVSGAWAGIAAAGHASTVKMTAKLQSAKVTNASGRFTGTLASRSNGRSRLSWTLTYRQLSSHVTKAELVVPAQGKQGAVVVQLCRSCKATAYGVVTPILQASTKALKTRPAWAIVYTKKHPKGEIRGRLVPVH
jgi:hypothetical protein